MGLDPGDNDPTRFWASVIRTLADAGVDALAELPSLLGAPGATAAETLVPRLVNRLAEAGRPTALVLDDYHHVDNPRIHEAVAALIDHLPANGRVTIASRADPPLPIPRWRARGQLTELRARHLRLDPAETARLLNRTHDLGLDGEQIDRLHERTEGWAAAVVLAALSLRDHPTVARAAFVDLLAGDDRFILDFLSAEVLAGLPQETRQFLLRTSVLDRLCGPLCDEVLGQSGSAAMLDELERSNLLVASLDRAGRWYRYHHLFRQLLQHELRQLDPAGINELNRRAYRWHVADGLLDDAIHHAVAAGEHAACADLIVAHWADHLKRGLLETVESWLHRLPLDIVASDARLCLVHAWVCINTGRVSELDLWLGRAERAVAGDPARAEASGLSAGTAMLRCIERYLLGDVGQAIAFGEVAGELERDDPSPWHTVGCPVLGIAQHWAGVDAARVSLEAAIRAARPAGNHLAVIHALGCLAVDRAEQAWYASAAALADEALGLADAQGLTEHWATAMARIGRADALAAGGRIDEAERACEQALQLSRRGVARIEMAHGAIALARIRRQRGGDVDDLLEQAHVAVDRCPDPGILAELVAATERGAASPHERRRPAELTPRERTVLRLLSSPLSLSEIARELYVSLNTVKTHTRAIYAKLGVGGRGEASRRAVELGLGSVDDEHVDGLAGARS